MDFDTAFPVRDAFDAVHVQAGYRGRDGHWHEIELWRRGEAFVHRRSDDGLELFVQADAQAPGHFRYQVLDTRRKALVEVSRTNLLRIGVFSDWPSLAHLLKAPARAVSIRAVADPLPADFRPGPADASTADVACEWRRIQPADTRAEAPLDVCWSNAYAMPVRVVAAAGSQAPIELLRLEHAEPVPPEHPALQPPSLPEGYAFVDADADIDPSGD